MRGLWVLPARGPDGVIPESPLELKWHLHAQPHCKSSASDPLTASNHGDDPTGRVDGMAQVVVRMENVVAEVCASPRRNIQHKSGSEHDVLRADGTAIELHGKAFLIEVDLTHFRAKFNIGQAASQAGRGDG